ncbi:hypothetical protein VTK73DRAFT_1778 [Phialemonium thermophilum]|uniref:Uncharacterized protein n=1 Tax=Phialemonium thermophilum TaxID=223376 RepID=A0ABR3X7T8_9PEZI
MTTVCIPYSCVGVTGIYPTDPPAPSLHSLPTHAKFLVSLRGRPSCRVCLHSRSLLKFMLCASPLASLTILPDCLGMPCPHRLYDCREAATGIRPVMSSAPRLPRLHAAHRRILG